MVQLSSDSLPENIEWLQSHEWSIVQVGRPHGPKRGEYLDGERADNFFGRQQGHQQTKHVETDLHLDGPTDQFGRLNVLLL